MFISQSTDWDSSKSSAVDEQVERIMTASSCSNRPTVTSLSKPLDILSPFQAFSADQYQAMLTPQVQAISSAKRDSLSMAQQDAIKSVIDRDPDEEDPWGPDDDDDDNGCPGM